MDLRVIGARAKEAASYLNSLGITEKNEGLRQAAQALLDGEEDILTANQEDVIRAAENGMSQGMIDRLPQEQRMAVSFGFPLFKESQDKAPACRRGYWCRLL